ncbi:MAG: MerR family transcriptional regulator [Ignavibacteriaceae bacterium]
MFSDENYNLPLLPIRSAAKILNISVHTLRMYEREGLIIPFKKASSHRLYSNADIERLKCIRRSINESKISIAGIKTIYSMIPCWEIVNCSRSERENCMSFKEHTKPCWTYNHQDNPCQTRDCRSCAVYNNYSECGKIKELIRSV